MKLLALIMILVGSASLLWPGAGIEVGDWPFWLIPAGVVVGLFYKPLTEPKTKVILRYTALVLWVGYFLSLILRKLEAGCEGIDCSQWTFLAFICGFFGFFALAFYLFGHRYRVNVNLSRKNDG